MNSQPDLRNKRNINHLMRKFESSETAMPEIYELKNNEAYKRIHTTNGDIYYDSNYSDSGYSRNDTYISSDDDGKFYEEKKCFKSLTKFAMFMEMLSKLSLPRMSFTGMGICSLIAIFISPRACVQNILFPGFRLLFGTLYPAYASYKAVRTKNVKEYVKWMMYWIVFAFFTCIETFTDIFMAWFPFYYEVKVVIVIWLLSPATKGSSTLYRKFVHPMLTKREQEIDDYINQAKEKGYTAVLQLGSKGVNYATNVIMQTAMKTMQYSQSENAINTRDETDAVVDGRLRRSVSIDSRINQRTERIVINRERTTTESTADVENFDIPSDDDFDDIDFIVNQATVSKPIVDSSARSRGYNLRSSSRVRQIKVDETFDLSEDDE